MTGEAMRRGVLLRVVLAAAALGSMGSLCSSGPDCGQACGIVQGCPTLNKTYYLSCSDLGLPCENDPDASVGLASCATCIDGPGITCATLAAGVCDQACVPGVVADAGP